MRKMLFLFLIAIGPIAAEDKVAFIKCMNDLRTTEKTMNEIIEAHNQQGFHLVDMTPIYAYQIDGSLQSNPIGKFKIPLDGEKFKWEGESSLDGSMKGSFSGKGHPSHFILKFNK
ncbi:MAG: hypothetical protein LLG04_12645 [Parachlamydia sp.]|nr:hypothetical protein [Parachlamydia sp.]